MENNAKFKKWEEDRLALSLSLGIDLPFATSYTHELNRGTAWDAAATTPFSDITPAPIPLITPNLAANNTFPAIYSATVDSRMIKTMYRPWLMESIYKASRWGDLTSSSFYKNRQEIAGSTATYDDYNREGRVEVQYASFHLEQVRLQTIMGYGDLEVRIANRVPGLDHVSNLRNAVAMTIKAALNYIYVSGYQNKRTFGMLTFPDFAPVIAPDQKASGKATWDGATGEEIYNDYLKLLNDLILRNKGNVNVGDLAKDELVLVVPPAILTYLRQINKLGTTTVLDLIKQATPRLEIFTLPELATASGNLIQLFLKRYEGVDTARCYYSQLLQSHGPVRDLSSYQEKYGTGTWGWWTDYPIVFSHMLGV